MADVDWQKLREEAFDLPPSPDQQASVSAPRRSREPTLEEVERLSPSEQWALVRERLTAEEFAAEYQKAVAAFQAQEEQRRARDRSALEALDRLVERSRSYAQEQERHCKPTPKRWRLK